MIIQADIILAHLPPAIARLKKLIDRATKERLNFAEYTVSFTYMYRGEFVDIVSISCGTSHGTFSDHFEILKT